MPYTKYITDVKEYIQALFEDAVGQFTSDPYPGDDWAGSTKWRMYVDMVCATPVELEKESIISLEILKDNIPDFDWAKGHSGVLLPDEIADKLIDLLNKE